MQFTERLGLKKPDQNDIYNVDDFNYNYQKISESFAGIPIPTEHKNIDDFVASEQAKDIKKGDAIVVNGITYIMVGDNPLSKDSYIQYGAESIVFMHEYVPIDERVRGTIYVQLGTVRNLIIKVFKKFYGRETIETDTNDTLTFKETVERTTTVNDGNNYRFLCKNLTFLEQGDTSERIEGKIYCVADPE